MEGTLQVTRVVGVPFDVAVDELVRDPVPVLRAGLRAASAACTTSPPLDRWRIESARPVPLGAADVRVPIRLVAPDHVLTGSLRLERLARCPPVVRLGVRVRRTPATCPDRDARRALADGLGAVVDELTATLRLRRAERSGAGALPG